MEWRAVIFSFSQWNFFLFFNIIEIYQFCRIEGELKDCRKKRGDIREWQREKSVDSILSNVRITIGPFPNNDKINNKSTATPSSFSAYPNLIRNIHSRHSITLRFYRFYWLCSDVHTYENKHKYDPYTIYCIMFYR